MSCINCSLKCSATGCECICHDAKWLICGKCQTKQLMTKSYYGKEIEDFSWRCNNCNDLISQSSVRDASHAKEPKKEVEHGN